MYQRELSPHIIWWRSWLGELLFLCFVFISVHLLCSVIHETVVLLWVFSCYFLCFFLLVNLNSLVELCPIYWNSNFHSSLILLFLSFPSLFGILILEFQVGDLKGFFGLFMVNLQILRGKFKILDLSFGHGTGKLGY